MSGNGISWDICKSAPRSRQITTPAPHHSVFLHTGCPSCCPTNSVKALKARKADRKARKIKTSNESVTAVSVATCMVVTNRHTDRATSQTSLRSASHLLLGARHCRSISPVHICTPLLWSNNRTDRRTDGHSTVKQTPLCTLRAVPTICRIYLVRCMRCGLKVQPVVQPAVRCKHRVTDMIWHWRRGVAGWDRTWERWTSWAERGLPRPHTARSDSAHAPAPVYTTQWSRAVHKLTFFTYWTFYYALKRALTLQQIHCPASVNC